MPGPNVAVSPSEEWADWLLAERFGGDAEIERSVRAALAAWRSNLLGRAAVQPGDTVLDAGCGDGLIGLAALDLVGPGGRVIFNDISGRLLDHCRAAVAARNATSQCDFVRSSLEEMTGVADASVDVVTTRSVLMHVRDRSRAFARMHRLLRIPGRIACFEAINRHSADPGPEWYRGYPVGPHRELFERIRSVAATHAQAAAPMFDFDERDLVEEALSVGFNHVRVELELDVQRPSPMRNWRFLYSTRTHPAVPSLEELASEALDAAAVERLEHYLRPLVEGGEGVRREALCYLTAARR